MPALFLDFGSEFFYNSYTRLRVEILGDKHRIDCANNQCGAFLMQLNTSNGLTTSHVIYSLSEKIQQCVIIIGAISRLVVRVENLVVH